MTDDDVPGARPVADEASDPTTDAERLYQIVLDHPELRPDIAANPGIYPALRDWLRGLDDPEIDAALELADARAAAGALPPADTDPARTPERATPPGRTIRPVPDAAGQPGATRASDEADRTIIVPGGAIAARGDEGLAPEAYPPPAAHPAHPAPSATPDHPPRGTSGRWKAAALVLAAALIGLIGWTIGQNTRGGPPAADTSTAPSVVPSETVAPPGSASSPTPAGPEPTATTSPATPTASPTEQEDPQDQLETRRQESLEVATFDGHWVVQLASKYNGQVDPYEFTPSGTHTFYLADIWREHQQLTDLLAVRDVPVYLFEAGDFGAQRERHNTYWVTIADPGGLNSKEEAEQFCAELYPERSGDRLENSCVARELLPPFWR